MSEYLEKRINWNSPKFRNFDSTINSAKQDIFSFIIGYAKEKKYLNILDVGCGKGDQWNWYFKDKNKFDFNLNIIGVEPFLNLTSKNNIKIIKNIETLLTENKQFDVVVSMSVLEHVFDREEFIKNCSKLTNSNGFLIINYDNGHFFNKKEWKRNIFGKLIGKFTYIKNFYQDFVDIEKILDYLKDLNMYIDDNIDYHLLIEKSKLNIINKLDADKKLQLFEKIHEFENEISNIINIKTNPDLNNKITYSTTLVAKFLIKRKY